MRNKKLGLNANNKRMVMFNMEIEAGSALPQYDDLPTPISPAKSPNKKGGGKVLNLEKLKMEF